MQAKILEVRDRATFLPVLAVRMTVSNERQRYLLMRAGYSDDTPCVLMTKAEGRAPAQYDPYEWGGRTYPVAHDYITRHWCELRDGDVVDVEFILGETEAPKESESGKAAVG